MINDLVDNRGGYTLIELIVVVAVMSMVLFFTVPRFQKTVFVSDTKQLSQWLIVNVKALKERAVRDQKNYRLHINMTDSLLWITHDEMSEEAADEAQRGAYQLPSGVRVLDVEYPGQFRVDSGSAVIRFYKKGYSERALIHVADEDDNRVSYHIEPFLSRIGITPDDVGFEG